MSRPTRDKQDLSRRTLLKGLGLAPLFLRPSPLWSSSLASAHGYGPFSLMGEAGAFPLNDYRLTPHYPAKSPLEDVLRLVAPGTDTYVTEKYAFEIASLLAAWGSALKASPQGFKALQRSLDPAIQWTNLVPLSERTIRSGYGIDCVKRQFSKDVTPGREGLLESMQTWLGPLSRIETAEFQTTAIEPIAGPSLTVRASIRYDLVAVREDASREERVGNWQTIWTRGEVGTSDAAALWRATRWEAGEEVLSVVRGPGFIDVTEQALGTNDSYRKQLFPSTDYWRTVLDSACGIDVYGNNGLAAGDYDNDGFDDLYICQPAGLPNRLYRNRGDGTFEDVTEKAGVGVLDGTSCALFADFRNRGVQDLLVVCSSGPLLFLNQGDTTFALKQNAFRFARAPEGSFTHAALADYDRDGRLDIYFCLYSYYLGLDQYHYPIPYFDARNGPPNFLMHNEGDGVFTDKTQASGLNAENNRYSFACAWGQSGQGNFPDLYVANDFGRSNLYRNRGDGTFSAISNEAHVDDPGAGMSAAWCDIDNNGGQEIYAANMWSAAGQRVSAQPQFKENASSKLRAFYRRHARGNSLYSREGKDSFQNISQQANVEMGRWSWCSDFWDFDHDGYPDLYVANGYISGPRESESAAQADLGSFFWRQVVAKSPDDATPSLPYEHGWNALNELIRSDHSWSGYERNVLFANNRDGTFCEVSGALGMDFPEDGRSFVLADLDHDGRLEVILKNRNSPQLRILHNSMPEIGSAISFRLKGAKSNRDAVGAAITVEIGKLKQTKYLQAGSGFLAQHTKEVFFGLGKPENTVKATVLWPSGLTQQFQALPSNHQILLEEGSTHFTAHPFASTAAAYAGPTGASTYAGLPASVDTWLIEPLKAPDFSLHDAAGTITTLRAFAGSFVLLVFWTNSAPPSLDLLRQLDRSASLLIKEDLKVLAVNLDSRSKADTTREHSAALSFPVLEGTEEVAGVYNIIYRYLFDRRRDLALPSSFLIDKEGMIVKVYQGIVAPAALVLDAQSIPTNSADRLRKALSLGGRLYQGVFQRNDFTYGVAMFQHGYLDQAAASFEQVIAAKPDNAEGYYNLGTLNLRRNDFDRARGYLEQTLRLRPDYPEAWNNLGMIAAQQGNSEEAIRNFKQSLLLRPAYATALLNLGNVYRRQKAFDQAQACLNQAIALQPDDAEVNYSLGMLYAQQGQLQPALDYLQRAIALRPDYPEALNNLGVIYVRQQDYSRAEEQFRTGIRIAPGFDQSYLNLARLYAIQHDKDKARTALQDLLRLQPQNQAALQGLQTLDKIP